MKVRYPKWDFSNVRPHWAPHIEFAQRVNASSTIPSYVEPYLVKVMLKAKAQLDPKEKELHEELAIFIKQEAQHCKQHNAFNQRLRTSGYPELERYEREARGRPCALPRDEIAQVQSGLRRWFRSARQARRGDVVRRLQQVLGRRRPERGRLVALAHGRGIRAPRSRVQDLSEALRQVRSAERLALPRLRLPVRRRAPDGYGKRVREYLLGKDRERMTPEERAASIAREKEFAKTTGGKAIPELLKVLSPFYDPAKTEAPEGVGPYLTQYEVEGPAAATRGSVG